MSSLPNKRNSKVPQPFSFSPSANWEGNDGTWSTFIIRIGTPAQTFRVLISTAGQETWVPLAPEACLPTDPANCGNLRGAQTFENAASAGFETNESTTWEAINLFGLGLEENLGYEGNGEYGFDTVGLQIQNSGGPTLEHQVVAGIASKTFMFGVFALGTQPTNFSDFNNPQPSFMWSLRNQTIIPSLSYGYSAGAYYLQNGVPGSLILGGYDATRIKANNLTIPFTPNEPKSLNIGIQTIQAQNTLAGDVSLLPRGILSLIDSTVPEIWLPLEACNKFQSVFGLTYDNFTDRYLVNDTVRNQLKNLNSTLTFTLGSTVYGGDTIEIAFPYAAFDLQASYPIYPNATNYFPIRRAANASQYVVGRTFLQEAYLVVDYERSNFTIAQALFPEHTPSNIVSILPAEPPQKNHHSLSRPVIVGIAIAIVVVSVCVLLSGMYWRHKRKKLVKMRSEDTENKGRGNSKLSENDHSVRPTDVITCEMDTGMVPEIDDNEIMAELQENVIHEISGD